MIIEIGNFKVITRKQIEQLNEQIIVPYEIRNDKPANYTVNYKTREFTIFHQLSYKDILITEDLFNFIALIEAIKGFAGNRFMDGKTYIINKNISVKMTQQNKQKYLNLKFLRYSLYLDKLECSILSSQLSKIIQKCEAWQE